jgi:hypothetical protein
MTDFRASMLRTASPARALQILSHLRGRVADIQLVGWPRLEHSLRLELIEVEAIAKARGLVGTVKERA